MEDLRQINIPKYDELSVKNIAPRFNEDAAVMRFLPDRLPKNKLPDRTYFFNVLNTVHSDYCQQIVAHANKQRFKAEHPQDHMDEIKMTEGMWNELNEMPFFSCKTPRLKITPCLAERKGKTLHLLKQSAKQTKGIRKRKRFEVFDPQRD